MSRKNTGKRSVVMERKDQTEEILEDAPTRASGQEYVGGGAKNTHHGYTFQFHLLMLYGIRAFKLGLKDFQLATEMADADKFDDVILSYCRDTLSKGRCFQFVQAKHARSKNTKSIRASQLFDEHGGDFSLTKYFDSFRKIKRNSNVIGDNDVIESLVICSNMAFKFGEKFGQFVLEEAIFQCGGVERILSNSLLNFKSNFCGRKQVVTLLKNSCIDIPVKFSEAVIKGNKLIISPSNIKLTDAGLLQPYCRALLNEVIHADSKTFREGFVHGSNLSCAADHFRDELWIRYLNLYGMESTTENSFKSYLRERTFEVDVLGGLDTNKNEGLHGSPKAMAKHFEHLIQENKDSKMIRLDQSDSKVLDSISYMMDFVLIQKENLISFHPEFLSNGWMPKTLKDFKESLKARMENIGLEFKELENYSFKIDDSFLPNVSNRYNDDRLELDVREFLVKLSFALQQSSIDEMEKTIKQEIASCLNVKNANNAYCTYFNMMYAWAESRDARYMTEKDLKEFFEHQRKDVVGCIRFNLRDPVIDFVGREKELKEIQEFLHVDTNERKSCSTPRSFIISGLGGMGKSELAREYAKRNFESLYNNIVWISAENNESLQRSFTTLAFQSLGLKRETTTGEVKDIKIVVEEVYNFFRGKNALFIFDNAEVSNHLRTFFPNVVGNENTYVLVTSRSKDWRGFRVISLENFSVDEACHFIEISIGHFPTFNRDGAHELAKVLSFFPLALKQAISFIDEKMSIMKLAGTSFSISNYLELFRKKTDKLLNYSLPEELLNNYSLTTFKTMNIAVEYVKKSKHSKVGIDVLNTISYLSPDNIDTNILCSFYPNYSEEQVGLALSLLSKLSIVSFEESNARIHRLIQLVNRISLRNRGEEEKVLSNCFYICTLMDVEHIIMVWEASCKYKSLISQNSHAPAKIMAQLSQKSMWKIAMDFGEKAIKVLDHYLGSEHLNSLITRRVYARVLYFGGMYKEAATLQKELLNDFRRILGDDHPELFELMYHYGVSVLQLNEREEALKIFNDIIERGKFIMDDKFFFSAKFQVIQILDSEGRQEESNELYNDVHLRAKSIVEEYERGKGGGTLGNPITEEVLRHGSPKINYRIPDKVLKIHDLFQKKTGMVGNLEVDTIIEAKIVLARHSRLNGKWEELLVQLQSGLELLKENYGEEHIRTRGFTVKIIEALIKLGKFEQAVVLLEKELEYQKVEGCPMNSYTCLAKAHMVDALLRLGRNDDAVPYIVECIVTSKNITESMLNKNLDIISFLMKEEKYEAAMQILAHWFTLMKGYSGNVIEPMDTLTDIAKFLSHIGRKKDALEVLKNIYNIFKVTLGEENLKTLKIKYLFANIYCDFGKPSKVRKGLGYLLELHEVLCSTCREDNSSEVYSSSVTLMGAVINGILMHGSGELAFRTLKKSHEWALQVLGAHHPFTKNINPDMSTSRK